MAKLKQVKCTTQELNAVVSLLEQVNVSIIDGVWVYEMYIKFKKAFEDAAKADPDWVLEEENEVVDG